MVATWGSVSDESYDEEVDETAFMAIEYSDMEEEDEISEVLAELVKLAQKRGLKGSKGRWKDFLRSYDKKFGVSLSDPSKRSIDVLLAFLKTFSQNDLKYTYKVFQCHSNQDAVEQLQKSFPDSESAEQGLVYLTLEHPEYPRDYSFPSHEEGWLVTRRSYFDQSKAMVAIDCEMVLCQDGTEALVRICAVDRNLEVKLNEFVNRSKPIADYRTEITGITAGDLDGVSCSLADVQTSMKKLLSHGTILIGHSLHNDLRALKIDHARVIDTSYAFKYQDEPYYKPSVSNLCKSVLRFKLRKMGSPHICLDDASAAMKLVLAKVENGVDNIIPLVHEEVAALLVHRIPVAVHSQELHKVIPGEFTVAVKANRKGQADKYTAYVNFKNQHEANEAFDKLEGNQEKDTWGRPQKLVSFHLDSGISGSLCVRKMVDNTYSKEVTPMKRSFEEDKETVEESKKPRTDYQCTEIKEFSAGCNQCETHSKEIERLKKELSHRDEEISSLNRLIVNLVRKHAL
ncbi:putative protein-like [Capsicum annuum]|uniref:Exonuclease domain-containing protein n=2 Tax=Capsicum annuum TaxID=4072 RepID=A0A2G2YM85_CAPAN|nr:putative protein-like [Capsicum annuum]PHT70879.1 hypothetical protein T459_25983 [Capsicum annuum]